MGLAKTLAAPVPTQTGWHMAAFPAATMTHERGGQLLGQLAHVDRNRDRADGLLSFRIADRKAGLRYFQAAIVLDLVDEDGAGPNREGLLPLSFIPLPEV